MEVPLAGVTSRRTSDCVALFVVLPLWGSSAPTGSASTAAPEPLDQSCRSAPTIILRRPPDLFAQVPPVLGAAYVEAETLHCRAIPRVLR